MRFKKYISNFRAETSLAGWKISIHKTKVDHRLANKYKFNPVLQVWTFKKPNHNLQFASRATFKRQKSSTNLQYYQTSSGKILKPSLNVLQQNSFHNWLTTWNEIGLAYPSLEKSFLLYPTTKHLKRICAVKCKCRVQKWQLENVTLH